jgi:hypothetical protein
MSERRPDPDIVREEMERIAETEELERVDPPEPDDDEEERDNDD